MSDAEMQEEELEVKWEKYFPLVDVLVLGAEVDLRGRPHVQQ